MIQLQQRDDEPAAKIVVVGVGGGGNNALNRMADEKIDSVKMIAMNTDQQDLNNCKASLKVQLGEKLTKGLGAGANPDVGRKAAEESANEIEEMLEGTDMLLITCGMGGGTGTGASPVIARIAKEKDILTIAIVTTPFKYEGKPRMNNALTGIEELKKYVDTYIIIPNEKLIGFIDKKAPFSEAFKKADEVLQQAVVGITSVIIKASEVSLDFADVNTAMKDKGTGHIGIGVGSGERKAEQAVNAAINSPLLDTDISGATNVLCYVSGNASFGETTQVFQTVYEMVGDDCNIINGQSTCEDTDEMTVVLIATGVKIKNKEEKSVLPKTNPQIMNRGSYSGLNYYGSELAGGFKPPVFEGFNSTTTHSLHSDVEDKSSFSADSESTLSRLKIDIPDFINDLNKDK